MCEEWFLSIGCAIGYWQGDVGKLVDDIAALKPAMFIGVPRVFDRIYSRIDGQVKGRAGQETRTACLHGDWRGGGGPPALLAWKLSCRGGMLPFSFFQLQIKGGGFITRALFHWGYQRKLYYMQQGYKQAQVSARAYVLSCFTKAASCTRIIVSHSAI